MLGIMPEARDAFLDLGDRAGDRLAHLLHRHLGEMLLVRLPLVGDRREQRGALVERRIAPRCEAGLRAASASSTPSASSSSKLSPASPVAGLMLVNMGCLLETLRFNMWRRSAVAIPARPAA
jgi:hypothetical protein